MGKISAFLRNKLGTNKGKLTFREKLTLALPGPASVIGPIIIHNTLMKFYTDIIGLDAKFYGWIYLLYSIWNAINDPLLGAYIDKMPFSKKRGKYVYLMRVTAPTMLVSIFFMLLSSPSWNDWVVFGVLLAELFIFDTAYTVYSVAYNSYFLLAAPDKEERVDVDIIRTYIGNVLGAITTIIPTLLLVGGGNRKLVIPVFSVVILVNAGMYFVALRTLKDKAELYETATPPEHHSLKEIWTDVKRIIFSRPFLTYLLFYIIARGAIGFYFTPFLYFMDSVVKSTNTVATLADVIPGLIMLALLPWAGKKIKVYGSKTITLLAFIPAILGFSSLLFITKGWQAVISYTLIVFALNVIQTAGVVLNGELIDYDEMQTGTRKTGLYGGLFALLTTSLTSLQATIFSNIISHFGYDGTLAVQSARAVWGIRVGAGLIPIIMCVVGFIPMLFFPIGRKLEREISDFNVAAREGRTKKMITTKGNKLYTKNGQEFIAKGINMVCKDKSKNYIGDYTAEDFRFLKEHGFNLIRLGLIWDGAEPEPGKYDENYFKKIDNIIALAAAEEIPVFLDMHQDLYGVMFEDGVPAWATVTDNEQHIRTELWSESYLISPAVQHAFDNFWKNALAPDGVGIKTHYLELLKFIAKRYEENPYVVGFDVMNEPFPGTPGATVGEIMGRFLQGGDISAFNNPESVTAIINEILPITSKFEAEILNPFYDEAARAIRSVNKEMIFMFEANYFANAGIPSVLRPAVYEDGSIIENQVFVPHGYDILVDTEAYDEGGLERVGFIFGSILDTAKKMGIPAIIGEWGCYPNASNAQKEQAKFLLKLFKDNDVGNVYFDYSHLHDGGIIEVL